MTDDLGILKAAQLFLLNGEAEQALACMQRFESEAILGKLPPDKSDEYVDTLQTIRLLAQAAASGTATALHQMREISAISHSFNAYDSQGRRLLRPVTSHRDSRY